MYVLGIDVGTTGTKALLIDEKGNICGKGYKGYKLFTPFEGAFEQNPHDWFDAVCCSVREAVGNNDVNDIKALSVSAQGGSVFAAAINKSNEIYPLTNAYTWMDCRAENECKLLAKKVSQKEFYYKTGWRLNNWSVASKILWLEKNKSQIYNKTDYFITTADYIYYKLTAKKVIDPSSAAMFSLFNIYNKNWDDELLLVSGINKDKLFTVTDTGKELGKLTKEASAALGLCEDTVVYCGAHDQYAASIGADVYKEGDLLISTGTTWVVFGLNGLPVYSESFIASGVHPSGKYGAILSAVSSGTVLDWTKEIFSTDYNEIDIECQKRVTDEKLLFYPYITGAGDYHKEKNSMGAIKGLTLSHDKFDIIRAAMEGVAFEIKIIFEEFVKNGIEIKNIKMIGGASKSPVWCQIVSNITGKDIKVSENSDVCCLGAAKIALKSINNLKEYPSFNNSFRLISPVKTETEIYNKKYLLYKQGK